MRGESVCPFLSAPLILRPAALGFKLQRVKIKGVAINGELYLIALRMVRMDAPTAGAFNQLLREGRQVQPHAGTEVYRSVIGVVVGITSGAMSFINLSGKNGLPDVRQRPFGRNLDGLDFLEGRENVHGFQRTGVHMTVRQFSPHKEFFVDLAEGIETAVQAFGRIRIVRLQHQLFAFSAGGQSIVQINDADLLDTHFHVSLNVLKIAVVGFPAVKFGGFADRDVGYPIIGRKERLCCRRSHICLDVPACDLFRNLLIGGILLGIPAFLYPVIPPSGRLELRQDFFIRLFRKIQFQTMAFLIDNELRVHRETSFI